MSDYTYLENLIEELTVRVDELESRNAALEKLVPKDLTRKLKEFRDELDEHKSAIEDLENS